jgi:hypothetical protein
MDDPGLMKFPWTGGPAAVDPVYGLWTYSTDFLIEKQFINSENSSALVILQKHPQTFLKLYFSP